MNTENVSFNGTTTWISRVLAAWDAKKYPTLGDFMASPEGQDFQRQNNSLGAVEQ